MYLPSFSSSSICVLIKLLISGVLTDFTSGGRTGHPVLPFAKMNEND